MQTDPFDRQFWHALETVIASGTLVIDRPKGCHHPRYPHLVYPLDYGFVEGLSSPDGNPLDVWKGSKPGASVDAVLCVADLTKMDTEFKVLLSCTDQELRTIHEFQNTDKMSAILIRRPR